MLFQVFISEFMIPCGGRAVFRLCKIIELDQVNNGVNTYRQLSDMHIISIIHHLNITTRNLYTSVLSTSSSRVSSCLGFAGFTFRWTRYSTNLKQRRIHWSECWLYNSRAIEFKFRCLKNTSRTRVRLNGLSSPGLVEKKQLSCSWL